MSTPRFHTLLFEHAKAQATAINSFTLLVNMTGIELSPARDIDFRRMSVRAINISGNSGTIPACIRVSFATNNRPQVIRSLQVEQGSATNDMVQTLIHCTDGSTNGFSRLVCENRERAKLERVTVSFNTVTNAGVWTAFTDYTNAVLELVLE